MKNYLLFPATMICLASCTTPIANPTQGVAGGVADPAAVSSPYQTAPPAVQGPGVGATTTGAGALKAVRGAREAASTVQTFRNLFGAF